MAGIRGKVVGMPSVRRKQLFILTGLIAIVGSVALGAGVMGAPNKKDQPPPITQESTRKAFGAPGEKVDPSTLWRTQEGARLHQLEEEMRTLQHRLETQERTAKQKEEEEKKRKLQQDEKATDIAVADINRNPPQVGPPVSNLPVQPMALGPLPPNPDFDVQKPTVKGIVRTDIGRSPSSSRTNGHNLKSPQLAQNSLVQNAQPEQRGLLNSSGMGAGGDTSAAPNVTGGQRAETFIPAGSFAGGVLLSGVDAPTGGQSQENPHPVIIEVLDLASLPNKFKADYKHCRITANAVGDLSSERAYIRLDRLSCISEDGGALDISIKGYVADQSGKAGVRGRLVSKQGQVLANALLSGVASGMGQAFSMNSMTNSVSALGATQTMKDGEQYRYGLGQGVGSALTQLSKYYITLAEKLFPVIEVDAGLPIDIVITRGVSVARK
jgi:conjugal transfer pilus assembly protein TraB